MRQAEIGQPEAREVYSNPYRVGEIVINALHVQSRSATVMAVLKTPAPGGWGPLIHLVADGRRAYVAVTVAISPISLRRIYGIRLDTETIGDPPVLEITVDSTGKQTQSSRSSADGRIRVLKDSVTFDHTSAFWSVSPDGANLVWRVPVSRFGVENSRSVADTVYTLREDGALAHIAIDLGQIGPSAEYLDIRTFDGERIVWSDSDKAVVVFLGRPWVVDRRRRTAKALYSPQHLVKKLLLANDSSALLVACDATTGGQGFWWVNLGTGRWRAAAEFAASILGAIAVDDRGRKPTVAYSSSTFAKPANIFTYHLNQTKPQQVTSSAISGHLPAAEQTLITYRNPATNQWAATTILRPAGSVSPLPTIVQAYPGNPPIVAGEMHNFGLLPWGDAYAALERGYAVMLADIPRSANHTQLGPAKEIAAGMTAAVEHASQTGWVDTARLGVIGHSYGGTMVGVLVTSTNLFKAGVAMSGTMDHVSAYAGGTESRDWFTTGQGGLGASLQTVPERYVDNSPVSRVDGVKAPLLLIHGVNDPSVHISQSEEMFRALAKRGKIVELVRVYGVGHGNEEFFDSAWMRALGWFDEHVRRR